MKTFILLIIIGLSGKVVRPAQNVVSVDAYNMGTQLIPQGLDPCGPWVLHIEGGHWISCRTCYTGGPTGIPYIECIDNGGLPE